MTSLKAPQVVADINAITSKSRNLQGPANNINITNAILFPIGQGPFPQIIAGVADIVNATTSSIQRFEGAPPFTVKSDEDSIRDAWKNFVTTQTQLLNTLIEKAKLLPNVDALGVPIVTILRSLEASIDTYSYKLIDLCPDDENDIQNQQKTYDQIIDKAITTYSGTS